ncbi:FecR family protein [Calycomorphotria hydatis]|uniref:FecR protein n=1 Tax=Calycomorphotria hydatis TaxID=2528027 RepID=A0A517TDJ4_9PLAN|nr:FecR domain-containing protein [Calycomorphotria hydatis]QDT66438.1 FecR protein [Calycomorphotria hydatis]
MSHDSLTYKEFISLTDACLDGLATTKMMSRLNALLVNDDRCRQWYVEYVGMCAGFAMTGEKVTEEECIRRVFEQSANAPERKSATMGQAFAIFGSLLTMALGVSVLIFWMNTPTRPIGQLISISADVVWNGQALEQGSVVRAGQTLTLTQGDASLELHNGVKLHLVAPASLTTHHEKLVSLWGGVIASLVPQQAIGFTVKSSDVEVVDLGTEFVVERMKEDGTNVYVKSGKVETHFLDIHGNVVNKLNLTAGRSATFDSIAERFEEVGPIESLVETSVRVRHFNDTLDRLEGNVRTAPIALSDLSPGAVQVADHVLLVAERSSVTLEEPLIVETLSGPRKFEAGTVLDSYLLHHDPVKEWTKPGIGAVSFHQPVMALIGRTDELNRLDELFARPRTKTATEAYRGLEVDEDLVEISADRKTVTFRFDVSPPNYYDHVRILVSHPAPEITSPIPAEAHSSPAN